MTEAEWLACVDPDAMRSFWWGKASNRKQRLFCCACCRRCFSVASDVVRNVIDLAERFADKAYSGETIVGADMKQALITASMSTRSAESKRNLYALFAAEDALQKRMTGGAAMWAARAVASDPDSSAEDAIAVAERMAQSEILRDIFGNPFRPATLDPAWRTPTAVALARGMYESRDFGAMPILADALQDAGCDSAEVLDHCRGPGPHVRGCWVADLVLGKE